MFNKINLLQQPNQKITCNLEDGNGTIYAVDINLRTLMDGSLICDIYVNDEIQVLSEVCCNKMPLLPTDILNGNMYFMDMDGNSDPEYPGFNDRYVLIYDTEFILG